MDLTERFTSLYKLFKLFLNPIYGIPLSLLIASVCLSLGSGIFEARVALLIGKSLQTSESSSIHFLIIAAVFAAFCKFLSSASLTKGASLAGYRVATHIFKSLQVDSGSNRLNDGKIITLLTRNIDYLVNRLYNPFFLLLGRGLSSLYLIFTLIQDILEQNIAFNASVLIFLVSASAIALVALVALRKYGTSIATSYKKFLINSTTIAKDFTQILDELSVSGSPGFVENLHRKNERKLRITESNLAIIPTVNTFTIEMLGIAVLIILSRSLDISEISTIAYIGLRLIPNINLVLSSYLRIFNALPVMSLVYPYLDGREQSNNEYSKSCIGRENGFQNLAFLNLPKFCLVSDDESPDAKFQYSDVYCKKGILNIITGKSGAGKTTYLESILGLQPSGYKVLAQGQIKLLDYRYNEITHSQFSRFKKYVAYCPQHPRIISASMRDNIKTLACSIDESQLHELLDQLRLSHLLGLDNCNLMSGGEKKRLSLVRTLLLNKPIVFLDEPTSGLNKDDILAVIECLVEQSQRSIVLAVTHEPKLINANYNSLNIL